MLYLVMSGSRRAYRERLGMSSLLKMVFEALKPVMVLDHELNVHLVELALD